MLWLSDIRFHINSNLPHVLHIFLSFQLFFLKIIVSTWLCWCWLDSSFIFSFFKVILNSLLNFVERIFSEFYFFHTFFIFSLILLSVFIANANNFIIIFFCALLDFESASRRFLLLGISSLNDPLRSWSTFKKRKL